MIDEKRMGPRQRRRVRTGLYLAGFLLLLAYYLIFTARGPPPPPPPPPPRGAQDGRGSQQHAAGGGGGGGPPHPPALLENLSLTAAQCEAAFPNLSWPIRDVVAQGPFALRRPAAAPVLARVRGGRLSVLGSQRRRDLSAEMLASRTSSLHQIHRALVTAPPPDRGEGEGGEGAGETPIPDTVFALNFQDQPFGTAWAYSRQADPRARPGPGGAGVGDGSDPDARTFLMPHFSFWAWKLPFVGSVRRAAAAIAAVEAGLPSSSSSSSSSSFASKIPKAVWRGTAWFNSVHNPRLRQNLLAAAKDKPWADVEALKWETKPDERGERTASNALAIEDFCRYRYILYTEGVTYSGRFPFLQMCASVVLSPPVAWMMHTTHLVRPVFSGDLPGLAGRWEPSEAAARAWPVRYAPGEANMVFVRPDWGDLEDTVLWLEAHPDVAEGIARRQRETFADGGYFSPAAETCYWRALIRGWAEVARWDEADLDEFGEGQTYEAFALTNGD